jgi:hypothetical protein
MSLPPLTVAAERIELTDGVLEIIDAGLDGARASAAAWVTASDVAGTVERVGAGVIASVSARVGDGGTATLDMRTAFGAADARDVTLELQGVPAAVFAEHAERLAGYVLNGGTVHATIEYRIDENGIDGNARVGGRGVGIEPAAGPLPSSSSENLSRIENIELALALLEDASGGAETSFDFRAPQDAAGEAYIGGMLAAGVVGELQAVAASPFDAIGAAAGVEGAALSAVSFPPGGAEPSEPATLDALAEALNARPRIGLRVPGVADGVLDRDALAVQQIELHVTLATAGQTLVARPQPVDFASPRHQDVLDEFARERLGDEQRETIASYFARTPDGRIVDSDRAAYYRALFDALVENEAIPENGIARLGRYRARAIADGLAARGIMESRIEIAPAVVRSDGEGAGEQRRTAASGGAAAGVSPPQVQVPLEVLVMAPSLGSGAEPDRDVGSPPATR